MIKLADKNTQYFDVDGTLVLHVDECTPEQWEHFGVRIPCGGKVEYVVPHVVHIKLLKEFKQKGSQIVVWTQGGTDWAEAVVKFFKLEDYVDVIVQKPTFWVDDVSAGYFIPASFRIWKPNDYSDDTYCKDR